MKAKEYELFVNAVCKSLEEVSTQNPHRISSCKSGEDFEVCVVEAVHEALARLNLVAHVYYTSGGHAFPDIVIEFFSGEKYGIEVKSSVSTASKAWKINGNSVLGSTKEKVIDTYIVFGKTALGHQAFRYKRYEDAISNVAVTHSPRYAIDMDIDPSETFFSKSGLSYKQISESEDPIGLVTSYFKSKGQRAWWLAESTPAAIRTFADISAGERASLIGYCFAHYPEVFSTSGNKFSRCAVWLASECSIVSSSLRDNFSAGGKFDYCDFGRISKIFGTLIENREYVIAALNDSTIKDLHEDWGIKYRPENDGFDKLLDWLQVAASHCPPKAQTGYHSLELLRHIMLKK
ncbi:MAG: hypothetical protein RR413_09310, partial [Christensenellaceae bacterium]